MIRCVTCGSALCLLLAAPPANLDAQFNPYGNWPTPYQSNADPRVRRANREKAVAAVGPIARGLVETHDEAVNALLACSKPVAVKLAEFHASGEMSKLPRPGALLRIIATVVGNGDDVAVWAINHARELGDIDHFDAYLLTPLEYALGLKPLEAGAAEARARRLNQIAMKTIPMPVPAPLTATERWAALPPDEKLGIGGGAALLVIVGLVLWRRKKSSIC